MSNNLNNNVPQNYGRPSITANPKTVSEGSFLAKRARNDSEEDAKPKTDVKKTYEVPEEKYSEDKYESRHGKN